MRVPRVKRTEGRRWFSRLLVGLALIIAVAVVVVVVENAGSSTPSASGNTSKPSGSTTVQRRNLVETDTESGTLSYNSPQTVYNRMSGTITWLPVVGQVIKPGQTLYKIDGKPVLLMDGTTPAYRDLSPSDSDGADIKELNRNLVKLGFNAANITVDDVWQAATTEGVDLLQESLGETETGTLTLGQIVFLPGDQLVTTVDGTLGSTGATNASATVDPASPEFVDYSVPVTPSTTPSAHTASHKAAKTKKCPSTNGTTTPSTTNTSTNTTPSTTGTQSGNCKKKSGKPTAEQQLQALLALLKAETQQLHSNHNGSPGSGSGSPSGGGHPSSSSGSPSSGGSGNGSGSGNSGSGNNGSGNSGSGNSGSGSATAILQTTSTQLVVTVDLAATVQSEAVEGEHVTVEMPNGDVVNGRITAVSPVAQSSSSGNNGNGNSGNGNGGNGNGNNGNNGSGSSSTIPVTITLSGHNTGAGLDQAAVSVNFVQQKATNVLSVPVTALLATGGGNYSVQEAAAPHTLIPVTTGLFAAGYVEISGAGIYPGLAVTDSQG
ncbi:MAG TPA: hypothetical protein VMB27_19265 [Solirubrobacteraceae bacterium]|nr:hypothetical protein [Solirubrobacteraceae bacterium]